MKDLKSKIVNGAVWMLAMRLTVQLLGILSSIILARILVPEDFGIVALAGSVYVFFTVFGQFGFDQALIQRKNPSADHYNAAWTANVLIGCLIALILIVMAEPATRFFGDDRIQLIVWAFAGLSIMKGFENIGVVNFRKYLEFKGDYFYFVIPKMTSFVVGVTAAILLRNFWALVLGMLAGQLATLFFSHFSQPFRPRFSLARISDLYSFSKWILISSVIGYLSYSGLEVLLGKIDGAIQVGLFGMAAQLAAITITELVEPVGRALFPGFSAIADDPARLRRAFKSVFGVTMLIGIPAAVGIFSVAGILVPVLLGDKWVDVVPILMILSLVGIVKAIVGTFRPILLAKGRSKLLTMASIPSLAVSYPVAIMLIPEFGAIGVALAVAASWSITSPIVIWHGLRELNISVADLLSFLVRPVVGSVAMLGALIFLQSSVLGDVDAGPAELVLVVCSGVAIYVSVVVAAWLLSGRPEGAEKMLLDLRPSVFRATK